MRKGICYLVGAGPGDPLLMTLKGRQCLAMADVIVYDSPGNPAFLEWAPAAAEIVCSGKTAGGQAMPQAEINGLLVARARAGKTVVRVAGGDPCLFARGGEEALALADAGCAFEVVPGVSSAIAGPAYAGIPLTHRAHNTTLTIFSGCDDPAKGAAPLDFSAIAKAPGTKVMLLGRDHRLADIAAGLLAAGMGSSLPVAIVCQATTVRQVTLVGTLSDIAGKAEAAGFNPPAVAVFGEVVALRNKLNWFEALPLFGKRIAVTRTLGQAGGLLAELRALGADAFEMPMIRIDPAPDKRAFYEAVAYCHGYDWIIFTSPNAVDAFFRAFFEIYRDAREFGSARIAAIGPSTAAKVRGFHLQVDVQPEKHVAEEIVRALEKETCVENLKILLPCAEGARDVLAAELARLGAIVDEVAAYRTVPASSDDPGIRRFRDEGADIVTFTSSSTAENFHALKLPLPPGLLRASIGPITSQTMSGLGMPADIEAGTHDIPGLVAAIVALCARAG